MMMALMLTESENVQGPVFVRKYRPALELYLNKEVGEKFEPKVKFKIRFQVLHV